jgi:hypothetical protein
MRFGINHWDSKEYEKNKLRCFFQTKDRRCLLDSPDAERKKNKILNPVGCFVVKTGSEELPSGMINESVIQEFKKGNVKNSPIRACRRPKEGTQ